MNAAIHLVLQLLAIFFLFWGVAGILLGAGLIFATAPTVAFMQRMNRWVSTRAVLKPVEIPHNVDSAVKKHPYWFGGLLIVASAYVIFVLISVGVTPAANAVAGPAGPNSLYAIGVELLWWFFLVGAFAAIATGAVLAFSPGSWASIEAKLNTWQSTRQAVRGGDDMHVSVLDRWAATRPHLTGAVIAAGSLAMGAASWSLLLPR